MSHAEQQEQERLAVKGRESPEIRTADAQAARNAGASDVHAAQALNPNRHSGSAGGDQNESIEIVALGQDGAKQVLAKRHEPPLTAEELAAKAQKGDLWARKFDRDLEQLNQLPAGQEREKRKAEVMSAANFVFRPEGKLDTAEQAQSLMDTGTLLAAEAKTNPVAEPIKLLKEWVEKQPESPQKEALRQEVRQQAADLSPEMKARMEHLEGLRRKIDAAGLEDGGIHQAIRPDQLMLQGHIKHQENPWQAFNNLRSDQQREIVKAFEAAGSVGQNTYEQQIEAVSESIPKGFYNVGKGLLDAGVSAATFVSESVKQPDKVPQAASQLAEHLSGAISNGVKVSTFVAGQAQDMAKTGDFSPAIKALGFVVETANERWQAMPLEKRTEKGSELIAEMGIGSLIGAGHKLAKSGKLVDALEEIAEHLKDLTAPGRDKAKQAIGKLLEDVLQPKGVSTNGVEIPIPKDIAGSSKGRLSGLETQSKGDNYFAMSAEDKQKSVGSAFRRDHDPYSEVHPKGWRKSHINDAGDLVPANPEGKYNGQDMTVCHHLDGGWNKKCKGSSPFTSFSAEHGSVITRYGDHLIKLDLHALKKARTAEGIDVEILELPDILKAIDEAQGFSEIAKNKHRKWATRDNEILIKGTIPGRFITVEKL